MVSYNLCNVFPDLTYMYHQESFESFEVSCDIKKSLFNDKTEEKEEKLGEGDEFEPVPLSSGSKENVLDS